MGRGASIIRRGGVALATAEIRGWSCAAHSMREVAVVALGDDGTGVSWSMRTMILEANSQGAEPAELQALPAR